MCWLQRKFHAYCIVLHRLQCLAKGQRGSGDDINSYDDDCEVDDEDDIEDDDDDEYVGRREARDSASGGDPSVGPRLSTSGDYINITNNFTACYTVLLC